MATKKTRPGKKTKDLPSRTLSGRQAKGVRGGKHIGNLKYGDITLKRGLTDSKLS